MWTRIKCAWSVLRGDSYAIPYVKIYQNILYDMDGAREVMMSDICDPKVFDAGKQYYPTKSSDHD